MNYTLLNDEELESKPMGLAITVGSVMAIACVIIIAVVLYRMFLSKEGSATVPGGWKFTWE